MTRYEREVKALDSIREVDWAYLAGLIDGEGCVTAEAPGITTNGRRRAGRAMLIVGMTDAGVIKWLHETLGGHMCLRPARVPTQKPSWNWRLEGRKTKPILERLLPYLKIKDRQARVVIEFIKIQEEPFLRLSEEGRGQLLDLKRQLLILNHRGAA